MCLKDMDIKDMGLKDMGLKDMGLKDMGPVPTGSSDHQKLVAVSALF
jgi:hypothetical protein